MAGISVRHRPNVLFNLIGLLQSTGVHILLTVALWGIPAAILGRIGFKLASEKALATAEVSADL